MFKKTAAMAASVTLALSALTMTASAASSASDCDRVAKADRTLCQQVSRQLPYAYATPGAGLRQIADGEDLVRDITHQGLSKAAMRHKLRVAAKKYARYATGSGVIVVNTATMRTYFGPDAHYEVHTQGTDVTVSIVEP